MVRGRFYEWCHERDGSHRFEGRVDEFDRNVHAEDLALERVERLKVSTVNTFTGAPRRPACPGRHHGGECLRTRPYRLQRDSISVTWPHPDLPCRGDEQVGALEVAVEAGVIVGLTDKGVEVEDVLAEEWLELVEVEA